MATTATNPKMRHVFGIVKAVADETADYDIEVICSTDAVDRSGEVIEQDGWDLEAFRRNPVFMAAHQHSLSDGRSPVIGSFTSIGVKNNQLVGRIRFAETALGLEYRQLYHDRHMRAVSVGFMSLRGKTKTAPDGSKAYHHLVTELYEISGVAVGCNQDTLAAARALLAKALETPPTPEEEPPATPATLETIAADIAAINTTLAALDERIEELVSLLSLQNDSINEDDDNADSDSDESDDESRDVTSARESFLASVN